MVKELADKAAQGRTYGNLGNTYYLLGEFEKAVAAHEKVSVSLLGFWLMLQTAILFLTAPISEHNTFWF